ncbi:MAG: VapC toxin family PIN domain ribonuclease [Candidatus Dactylopiibacterium carminicum]|uniref:Ribonuclease VapC n=1 Tax=Candidatus Dactylopiibacterium carminicum TaxID=857335 RepID=A0A272EZ49_9RHOO|nr:type II toxin-antitoxin system VapC family toxin [Candidatus Dactylopiibacterium carminicum]KAF7600892.1 VapC toxin family PIN domain ribonuclease [Candidatus Dactylopiibacterium carminicum]PAS95391.1 MAG: VapC toxin family PIN domain ribonuclease [Candidatus Dactylopiibacterium carminicum]PAS98598.1 MAG: VapC toxin family PIN domain ribonuclease [Candidatus Dactylopiibacterium carminicum]PAT00889.1 MAG: VapC toxin family PIN domain ribonuclease [Candidatus Dactylopiibacterium carminicum]
MILVDTSVWIDHLRNGEPRLAALLEAGQVLVHDFVIGELACGNLSTRTRVLGLLGTMPRATRAQETETLGLIERYRLMGRGIGYVDAHLLAATLIARGRLWSRDRRLATIAAELGVACEEIAH